MENNMSDDKAKERMQEMFVPIDRQIMMCDNYNDLLMLASAMLTSAVRIYDSQLTEEGRKKLMKRYV
jgi:hypothetical protein